MKYVRVRGSSRLKVEQVGASMATAIMAVATSALRRQLDRVRGTP